jgi:hypothetical protein
MVNHQEDTSNRTAQDVKVGSYESEPVRCSKLKLAHLITLLACNSETLFLGKRLYQNVYTQKKEAQKGT